MSLYNEQGLTKDIKTYPYKDLSLLSTEYASAVYCFLALFTVWLNVPLTGSQILITKKSTIKS